MPDCLTPRRHRNHTTLQRDEEPLILLDLVLPPARHFRDAVCAPDKNREEGDHYAEGEEPEAWGGGYGGQRTGGVAETVDVVGNEKGEDEEGEDLPREGC
jgi:hypothetical protein